MPAFGPMNRMLVSLVSILIARFLFPVPGELQIRGSTPRDSMFAYDEEMRDLVIAPANNSGLAESVALTSPCV